MEQITGDIMGHITGYMMGCMMGCITDQKKFWKIKNIYICIIVFKIKINENRIEKLKYVNLN